MNAFQIESARRAGLLAAWLLGAVVATGAARDAVAEEPAATNEVAVAATSVPATGATNAAVSGESQTATNAAAAAAETPAPKKKEPAYRGSDMQDAFKGAGSSKFGMSGRVNKMPAKKSAGLKAFPTPQLA